MADTTFTTSIQNFSLVNIGYRQELNESMWSSSFLKCDGEQNSVAKAAIDLLDYCKSKSVNLFYLPDTEKTFVYDWLKVDKTAIDITITDLVPSMMGDIVEQLDNTDIKVCIMQLNRYEFIIHFTINCDYISGISMTANWKTDNQFIREYVITKVPLTETSIAFKFSQRFK